MRTSTMLLPSHPLPLRSALNNLKPHSRFLILAPCCASSANTTKTSSPPTSTSTTTTRRFFQRTSFPSPHHHHHNHNLIRFASTTRPPPSPSSISPSRSSPSTHQPSSQQQQQQQQPLPLSWNAFLSLRKIRRYYSLGSSLLSSLLTTAGGALLISTLNLESISVFGLDPILVLILSMVGSGAVGWLLGPFVGNAVFGVVYRRVGRQIAEKEVDFYRRIKKHRVDPSGGSSANPVPDYYGEKIGSVKEYRNWMKDQRAFNKRRQNFL